MVDHGELDLLQPPLHQDWPVAASVRMPMARVEQASLAWVNWALAEDDPVFSALGRDEEAYRSHLLDQCAYRVTSHGPGEHFAAADRYGGRGLAGNGGAGRAAFLNQYYVKGVGRTPLLGVSDDFSHASGDAYLEEAVREAIFAEIFHAECPFGAIRTLAIMTYGQSVFWDAVDKTETLVLVIRRRFMRIGHFARALGFKSFVERDGSADDARVADMLMRFREAKGSDGVFRWLNLVGEAAAMQLGYFFAHRLNQGSPTLSNWSCNAAILDFGASSSIPSYRHINLDPVGVGVAYPNNVHGLISELAGLFRQVELHLGASAAPFDHARVIKAYTAQVHTQLLRIVGFSSQQISDASAAERHAFGQAADAFIATEQQSTVDLLRALACFDHRA
ncbi:hypothetical protein [Pelomonas aquatica]|jgi:hypothetical protein|uniref:Uncharacterized protein n=1 Tax=Pelomonas aquatica TaxID=431058 RepID=A0A9X4LIG8_9BURK|nr:hypothetical protein [Pelomonas aquatica]MCY4756788.1 hypothetical protein [Pelomonas aquatica]MDG0864170.1 hypothetical protein [Pelomonas aquatica]